jgi:DnaK suppressor protein
MRTENVPGLAEIRAQLESRLATVLAHHARLEAHLTNADRELPDDGPDRAQAQNNDEVLEAMESQERVELTQIRSALARMEAGTWGICEGCGEAIAPRRLAVMPAATTCIECATP